MLIVSVILFATMSTLVRVVPDINSTITVFYRFMFSLAIMGILALLKVFPLQFVRRPLLLLRGLTGGIATYLFYFSIQKLGVGKGTVIVYSYPVFASLFSMILLKEKISMKKWGIILAAFAGFILLSTANNKVLGGFGLYEFMALGGAILSAISIVLVKKLHDTDSTYAIFFAQAIVGLVSGGGGGATSCRPASSSPFSFWSCSPQEQQHHHNHDDLFGGLGNNNFFISGRPSCCFGAEAGRSTIEHSIRTIIDEALVLVEDNKNNEEDVVVHQRQIDDDCDDDDLREQQQQQEEDEDEEEEEEEEQ